MKALVRNPGETILSTSDVTDIDWETGAPLTNAAWCGGPYTLVQNYAVPVDPENGTVTYTEVPQEDVVVEGETIIIDGKEYTKEELRALLGE